LSTSTAINVPIQPLPNLHPQLLLRRSTICSGCTAVFGYLLHVQVQAARPSKTMLQLAKSFSLIKLLW
jgi:hypothetical protein